MPEILKTEGYSWEKGISLVSVITFFPNKLQQIAGVFNIAREIASLKCCCLYLHPHYTIFLILRSESNLHPVCTVYVFWYAFRCQ